jgi:hypothetical protein
VLFAVDGWHGGGGGVVLVRVGVRVHGSVAVLHDQRFSDQCKA